ncbi:MAG TPA: pyridoxal phosphate-dependent aminotransferase [Terriglobia bacterium]|nr:pyridoxal phosphate-dependent aminotransferase [Terriglobia bacterium]
MFSTRTNWPLAPNRLSSLLHDRLARGLPVLDLTESNPTRCGFSFDPQEILAPLRHPRALIYEPDPRGIRRTREVVAQYYSERGAHLDPDQIFLTASTSEAYSFVFRLLANPGDTILAPQPSYPLFDFLGALNDVEILPYPLVYHDEWRVDLEALASRRGPHLRAVLVVHPNNPTGSYIRQREHERMIDLCRRNQAAIIADEVFADYAFGESAERVATHAQESDVLTFALSGLSKICALPQMKLGWIVVTGPSPLRSEAMSRLEVIADTYLSVNAPVALAAPQWLARRHAIQAQILGRVKANLGRLEAMLTPGLPVSKLKADGGWYAILRVPSHRSDEEWAADLITAEGVSVHPGHFYDFPADGFLVLSLLPEPEVFETAAAKVISLICAGS